MFTSKPKIVIGGFSFNHGTRVGIGSPKAVGASYPQWVSR
jgi:hypothetical protein